MAEEAQYHHHDEPRNAAGHTAVEATDRGLFDFVGKKEEEKKCDEGEVIASQFDHKVKIADHDDEDKKILHRSSSSSSSSSEEEVGEDGEKKKKKKKKEIKKPNEKYEDKPTQEPDVEEKKGFLDKIKEKLPGGKKAEEVASPPPTPSTAAATTTEAEKKGLLEKIKDKIPGYNSKNIEEEKEKEASSY